MYRKLLLIMFTTVCYLNLQAQERVKVYDVTKYGIIANSNQNNTPLFSKLLEKIKADTKSKITIQFKKGKYHFYPEGADVKTYYISNHDQENPKRVGLNFEDLDNLTLDGKGSEFIFHGRMLPIAIIGCKNFRLTNLSIDFAAPQIAQISIIKNDTLNGGIVFETAPWVKYKIKDSTFYNTGEGWEMQPTSGIAFEKVTKRIVFNSGDIKVGTKGVSEITPGRFYAPNWKNKNLIPGTVVTMRSWQRPAPGIFVHKGKNLSLVNVRVHYAEGMGLLAQLTENIFMDRFGVCLKGKDDPRYFTTQADATHFSGCKGEIISKNGLYEGMMDDAINIHGTYLKLIERLDDHTVIAKYMHAQSYGFDWGEVGDTIQFIKSKTMDLDPAKNTISAIVPVQSNATEPLKVFKITFLNKLPDVVEPLKIDLGIENLTWTPSVLFSGNTIRNNRARGALFSTPKRTIVENNFFDHTSGSAILLCGDSNGWYETGSCRNLIIRNNKFINALTSMYQFTNAVISIYPEIPDLENQQQFFHSGIRIENNVFETFDYPILYAKSVNGLIFKNNKIITNQNYSKFHKNKKPLTFEHVKNEKVVNNTIDGKAI